jgi:hypothetical protein
MAEYWKNKDKQIQDKMKPEIDNIKKYYNGNERHFYIQAIYRRYSYHPLSSIKASVGFLIQIPFFFAAFHLLGNYEQFSKISFGIISDLSRPDGLLFGINLLPIIMSVLNIVSAYFYINKLDKSSKYQLWGLTFLFLVLLYTESSALLLYWTMNNVFSLLKNIVETKFNTTKFKKQVINIIIDSKKNISQSSLIKNFTHNIFLQANILFWGTIFIYKAIPMAASDKNMYFASYSSILFYLILFFIGSILLSYFIFKILPKKIRYFTLVLISFGALSGVYFSFINPFELGALTSLNIPHFPIAVNETDDKLLSIYILFSLFVVFFIIFNKIQKILVFFFILSNLILSIQTLYNAISPNNETKKMVYKNELIQDKKEIEELKSKLSEIYSFSTESNVIVIMMDMFQGNLFADIIENEPTLKKELDGFIYYPNTLSYGKYTHHSITAIAGGADFTIEEMNNKLKEKNISIKQQSENAYYKMIDKTKLYGYSYSAVYPQFTSCSSIQKYDKNAKCSKKPIYDKNLLLKYNQLLYNADFTQVQVSLAFAQISFVFSVPHRLKNNITRKVGSNPILFYLEKITQYSQMRNMIDLSSNNSSKPTFKFFQNTLTHDLWMMNKNCKVINKNMDGYDGFYTSAKCSIYFLKDFFDKLKKLKIYDNTKIIIVSDHGRFNMATKNYNLPMSTASALLLVKDFNSKDSLKTSMNLMTNIDTYSLALSGISNNEESNLDMIINYNSKRELHHVVETEPWNSYNIKEIYKIKENIFNKKNWINIDK